MAPPTNLLVFRDDSEQLSGRVLVLRLLEKLKKIDPNSPASLLSALILAGELESALADSGSPTETTAASLTNTLAGAIYAKTHVNVASALATLSSIKESAPDLFRVSHPEGFAYYALHPRDFAEAALRCVNHPYVGVIGIRSIGSTLSAVAASALAEKGLCASRIIVRPVGHPYDRKVELTKSQVSWLEQQRQNDSVFLIVDEGPGLSGSSFLSVAEALERNGVSRTRIILLGTRDVDPQQLCASEAARRWPRYTWQKASSTIVRTHSEEIPLSGGEWRSVFLPPGARWPASWTDMESLKFLSRDCRLIFKFEGLGEHGERNMERAYALSQAGFGPRSTETSEGMACYEFVSGSPFEIGDLSTEALDRIAEYCAFRAASFRTTTQRDQLTEMVRFNLLQERQFQLDLAGAIFETTTPIVPDCRMHPHEWIRSKSGTIMKVDGTGDGEGHFLPGPTDILWDLAGAIVEWNMDADAEAYLLAEFQKRSGRISEARLPYFLLAYGIFRHSYCTMAASSTQADAEKARLHNAALQYKQVVDSALQRLSAVEAG